MKPNKIGFITSMTINSSMNDFITADLSIAAQDPGALMRQFNKWMRDGSVPEYQEEFMCLYCGSPNKIIETHCKKCGAPRSFVIG